MAEAEDSPSHDESADFPLPTTSKSSKKISVQSQVIALLQELGRFDSGTFEVGEDIIPALDEIETLLKALSNKEQHNSENRVSTVSINDVAFFLSNQNFARNYLCPLLVHFRSNASMAMRLSLSNHSPLPPLTFILVVRILAHLTMPLVGDAAMQPEQQFVRRLTKRAVLDGPVIAVIMSHFMTYLRKLDQFVPRIGQLLFAHLLPPELAQREIEI